MIAETLPDAISALGEAPLDEARSDWYVPNPTPTPSGRAMPPLGMLKSSLLRARERERLFLSGHIGAGKSTELARLMRDDQIRHRYFVVKVEISPEEIPQLTSSHLLFFIAAALYQRGASAGLLSKARRWDKLLERLDAALFGPSGARLADSSVELKVNLVFVELRQQLKLADGRREAFRRFAETDGTLLIDLIDALADQINDEAASAGLGRVLVVIDEIDKVRRQEQIDELFHRNLAALRAPRVPILMTLPATITFGGPTTDLGAHVTHLRPCQVLRKTSEAHPMAALDPAGVAYLRSVLDRRVRDGLFAPEVVERAAVYAGGVLRKFFDILRSAAMRAVDIYQLPSVDLATFTDQLEEEKNNLARTVYPDDEARLQKIHHGHELPDRDALHLMVRSLVLEYNHDGIWWEVNPLLWHKLTPR